MPKVTFVQPVIPPPSSVQIELSVEEAGALMALIAPVCDWTSHMSEVYQQLYKNQFVLAASQKFVFEHYGNLCNPRLKEKKNG